MRNLLFGVIIGVLGLSTAQAQNKIIQVDFGNSQNLPAGWNNGQGMAKAGSSITLSTSARESTNSHLVTLTSFNAINGNGINTPDASLGLPVEATIDSFFGNTVAFGDGIYPQAAMEVQGLNPSISYSFNFFASRMASDGVNRETQYSVIGASTSTVYLNPTDNTSKSITSAGVRPNSSGVIRIEIKNGPNNNSPYGFFYLGSLRITYNPSVSTPTPIPATPTPPPVQQVSQMYLIDFGEGGTPAGWNNAQGVVRAGSSIGLTTVTGGATNAHLVMTSSFNDINRNGTTNPASPLGLPVAATKDSLFGNTVGFGDGIYPQAAMELQGLDASQTYVLQFFASRMAGDVTNRETQYTVSGSNSSTVYLNPTDNETRNVVAAAVQPTANGVIRVQIQKGPNNNSPYGFYYLGSMKVATSGTGSNPTPTPVPATPTPAPNQFPSVSAGANQTIQLPNTQAVFNGAASDSDGSISSVSWTQVSGPSTAAMSGSNSLSLTVGSVTAGQYVFRMTATDNSGGSSSATVALTVLAAPTPVPSGRGVTTMRTLGSTTAEYGFVEYLPPGYSAAGNWPVMIMLHGLGEEGNGTTQLSSVRVHGPNLQIDSRGKDYPMVILTPQSPGWWDVNAINRFVDWAFANYKVDQKRLYMTGLSMGGGGTWDYAAAYPQRVAAIVPICGAVSTPQTDANALNMINKGLAVWAAHAMDDGTVGVKSTTFWMDAIGRGFGGGSGEITYQNWNWSWSGTFTMHFDLGVKQWLWVSGQGYRDASGAQYNPKFIFTQYTSGGHGIWDRMYSDQQMYDWLLMQSRP